jgi:hypothetical protein
MEEEKFSEDPEENIKMENEFLKLKMKAQSGAGFYTSDSVKLPSQLENEFLKHVMTFEENFEKATYISVFERLGKPNFKPLNQLKADEISKALENIIQLLNQNNIRLDFCDGSYPDDEIYSFITEELFREEVAKEDNLGTTNFIYEEFHLNHRAEIEKNTQQFLKHWFNRNFNDYHIELASKIVTSAEIEISQTEFVKKFSAFSSSFKAFQNLVYHIDEIKHELSEELEGLGHSEGLLKYEAVLESGETIIFEGSFKLYMSLEFNCWSIFHFVMPGFNWD